MTDNGESEILRAWAANAGPWTRAVRGGHIASRRELTDAAVVEAVKDCGVERVLDIGCGEGWLVRALQALGIGAVGVDGTPALIEAAREAGGEFHCRGYEALASDGLPAGAQLAVCNFSLLGGGDVERLLAALPASLEAPGLLLIQTLHPAACDGEYCDGWRTAPWTGCGEGFGAPAPWYFRTLSSWLRLLERCGFRLLELREPRAEGADRPASLILLAQAQSRPSSSSRRLASR